ncbi:KAP family P-loop NTPase fold protein [Commensalibacter communis]|uniref:KAP family P-loop NTPase fold protein n=1 Tax=Commensalibacter communis TaxID=2972786 RepID=UPI0022FF6688|nr:P-loop NTPase fold protein [Commensalibacter communis]CAI3958789.1 KAP-like [Commensalibacter communis]CAI3959567.1 KAP-like [Commensalibacter communis]
MNDISANNLSADSPITDLAADCLGYSPFAKNIATILDNATIREDCLVLGIHGEWGSGKTSAINLVIKHLKWMQRYRPKYAKFKILNDLFLYKTFEPDRPSQIKETKPLTTIIHFSPWLFSNQENLTTAFFHELEKQLDNSWGNIKAFLKTIAALTLPSLEALSYLNPATSKMVGNTTQLLIKNLQKRPSLEQTKQALNKALKAQKRPLLIIIDDIDRLPADEMRQIFRLVKSVADLPYVTYLLGFDRKIVEKALEKDTDPEGPQWIEKIVQGSFDLPHIIPFKVQQLFWNKLRTEIWDLYQQLQLQKNCVSYFEQLLYPQLKNPRQVNRLINALVVGWLSVKNTVNPPLFIIIESWRLFNHDLYNVVKDNDDFCIKMGLLRHLPETRRKDLTIAEKQIEEEIKKYEEKIDIFFALFPPTLDLKEIEQSFYNCFIYGSHQTILSPSNLAEIENNLDNTSYALSIIQQSDIKCPDTNLSTPKSLIFYWKKHLSTYPQDAIKQIIYFLISITIYLRETIPTTIAYNVNVEIRDILINSFELLDSNSHQEQLEKLYRNYPFNPILTRLFIIRVIITNTMIPHHALNNALEKHQDIIKEIYTIKFKELAETQNFSNWSSNMYILFFNLLDPKWIQFFFHEHHDCAILVMNAIDRNSYDIYTHQNNLLNNNPEAQQLFEKKLLPLIEIAKIISKLDNDNNKKIAQNFLERFNKNN